MHRFFTSKNLRGGQNEVQLGSKVSIYNSLRLILIAGLLIQEPTNECFVTGVLPNALIIGSRKIRNFFFWMKRDGHNFFFRKLGNSWIRRLANKMDDCNSVSAPRRKSILERLESVRFFFINKTFPRFSPCETGWIKLRESLICKKFVQIWVVLIFFPSRIVCF